MNIPLLISSVFSHVSVSPLTWNVVIALIAALLLLCFSGIISAAEIAFFSLTPTEKSDVEEHKKSADHIISDLLEESDYLLATVLIANNFVNVAIVTLCTFAFNAWFDFSEARVLGFLFMTIILTFLLLLFGEIIPKIYAKSHALRYARKIAPTFNFLTDCLRPVSSGLVKSTQYFNKRLKRKHDVSMKDLSLALELTSDEIQEEKSMLEGIIKFYNRTAVEIMTPRIDTADIDIRSNFKKVLDFIVEVGYSRIPVYALSEDNIKGVLYIKDLLPYLDKPHSFRWQSLIRPAFFVPETKKIDDLMEDFRTNKIHLAVVVDEFGGTSGIVTMEDILEEIIGEIQDEYDETELAKYQQEKSGAFIFDAKILLPDFFKATGLNENYFEELTDDVDSLAGLVLELKGDFPESQEVLEYKDSVFEVLEVNKRRIVKVRFYQKNVSNDNEKTASK